MKRTPHIFTIGGATFDIFIRTKDHSIMQVKESDQSKDWLCFDYRAKVPVTNVEEAFGGGAANTSVSFSRFGFRTSFVGMIGLLYGDRVMDHLKSEGVDVSCVKKTSKDKTGFSTILSSYEGDRTVLAYSGANQYFSEKDLPKRSLEKADWIFLNHLSKKESKIPTALLKILKKNKKIKLAWNPGSEQLKQGWKKWKSLLAHTEILFLNKEEASLFTGKLPIKAGREPALSTPSFFRKQKLPSYVDDVSEMMCVLHKAGVKTVVITDGRNGAQVFDGKWVYFCPAITSDRVDTLGAGDAFASGFIAGYHYEQDLKMALKYGTLNANSTVHICGAQNGLLTKKEMDKRIKNIDISVLRSKIYFLTKR